MSLRLALFKCDAPIPAVAAEDGDYTQIFDTLLRNSLPKDAGVDYRLDSYDVRDKEEYPENVDDYHGILISGSAASAYENLEWINKLVSYVASVAKEHPKVKLIGICFGHQIIARALGGECVPNGGNWEVGPTEVELTDVGKELFGVSKLNIEEMHRDHVPTCPPSFALLGSTRVTPNQGMLALYPDAASPPQPTDVHILTLQGHPEFTRRIVDKIVAARASTGVLSADVVEDANRRAGWRNDGVSVVGRAIWRVLGVGWEGAGMAMTM